MTWPRLQRFFGVVVVVFISVTVGFVRLSFGCLGLSHDFKRKSTHSPRHIAELGIGSGQLDNRNTEQKRTEAIGCKKITTSTKVRSLS